MIKLVLSDMDNTIVPLGAGRVTDRMREAVHACLDAGVRFAPATGRDSDGLERFFCGDSACYASMLASNSKVIAFDGRLVREVFLDTDDVRRVCMLSEDQPDLFCLFRIGDIDYAYGESDVDFGNAADIFGYDIHRTDELPEGNVIALTVAHAMTVERQEEVRALVEGACPGLECLSPSLGVFDVMPRGWNKASGMQVLMDEMGISVDEVCVFGDSENDLPLLRACPNSVTVANAIPAAAEAARYHIGPCSDDAVADALFDIAAAALKGEMPAFMERG
ncbi:MAG: HAD family phosphatase [Atopobiaceae bacterium]|nr:HAD family phosphatase [Atopobiaceae bacterium]